MHDVVDLEEIAELKEAERRHYCEQSRQASAQAMEGAVNWGADISLRGNGNTSAYVRPSAGSRQVGTLSRTSVEGGRGADRVSV